MLKDNWLTSKEVMKALKITSCQLMHLRVSGKIKFKKIGNAYYYLVEENSLND
ncbi:helix-turn-helix domain-containing protein [Thalassomonas sp. M1454]|nr:helix-turn-helix domain-containing protein [Thalassomonas sp. M1454]